MPFERERGARDDNGRPVIAAHGVERNAHGLRHEGKCLSDRWVGGGK
jgi:hypothetical protein